MNHLCFHPEQQHQCHCGIEDDHTSGEFKAWHEQRGIPVLYSQIA